MREETPVELAFSNEIKEIEFFLGVAERAHNPMVRNLFKTLAREEMELLGKIGELKQMTIRRGRWFGTPSEPSDPEELRQTGAREGGARREKEVDDFAALRTSILLAEKGAKLFSDLAQKATDPRESRLYYHASNMEEEHMRSLNDALFYLENPQGWLGDRERSRLDGA